jgi:hypothetical protein
VLDTGTDRGEAGVMEPHLVSGFLGLLVTVNLTTDASTVRKFIRLSDAVTKIIVWKAFFQKFPFR